MAAFLLIPLTQRAPAYLSSVLYPICHDVRPSPFSILPDTSPGPRFRRNIDINIVFGLRELACVLELKCRVAKRRPEHDHGSRDPS